MFFVHTVHNSQDDGRARICEVGSGNGEHPIDQLLKLLAAVAIGYALLLAGVYFMQGRMLYLPDVAGSSLALTPATYGMDYEDVHIEASDGVALHGWFIAGESKRVLLFFHGNAGNISHRLDSLRQFQSLGWRFLLLITAAMGKARASRLRRGFIVMGWRPGST